MGRLHRYPDENLWRARFFELVPATVRERHAGYSDERKKAMHDVVGIWGDRRDIRKSEAYVRRLRKGARLF